MLLLFLGDKGGALSLLCVENVVVDNVMVPGDDCCCCCSAAAAAGVLVNLSAGGILSTQPKISNSGDGKANKKTNKETLMSLLFGYLCLFAC